MLPRLITGCLALLIPWRLMAEPRFSSEVVRTAWGTEKGLPQNSVTAMAQTADGYLWLATFGGLARFDGVSFAVFDSSNTPQLKSMRLRALYTDKQGALWIGTEHGGLTEYRGGSFHTYSTRDGLPANVVVSLAADGQGRLLVGTTNGAARLAGSRFIPIETTPSLPHDTIYSIDSDHAGSLWFGTESSGLVQVRGNVAQNYASVGGLPFGRIWALTSDRTGNLWIGSDRGLIRFHDGKLSLVKTKEGKSPGPVIALRPGTGGVIWVGSATGIYRLSNGFLSLFDKLSDRGDSLIRTLFIDREGSVWAGTDEGLRQWRQTNVSSYVAAQGLTNHPVASIYRDRAGKVWIGSLGGGLFRYGDGKFTQFPGGSRIDSPASITEDRDGNLWLGDWNRGLLKIKSNQITPIALSGLDGKAIRSEYVDSSGILWIGTDNRGIYKLEKDRFINYRQNDGLLSDTVVYIFEDRERALWLVCPNGISRFDGHAFKNFQDPDILLARTLQQDPNGALWVGTYGYGLFRFRNGAFRRVTTENGLPESVVSSMISGEKGEVWMSGNRGIYRCSWQELNDIADGKQRDSACVSFGVEDGLEISEANGIGEPAAARISDGEIWFAMVRGVAAVHPVPTLTTVPPVVIEQVLVEGKAVPNTSELRVQPDQRSIQIVYGALTFLRPQQVRFKYKLDGTDREWTNAGHRRTVAYQGLSPGNYTFRVVADNGFGIWNTTGTFVQIRVLAPFWRTGWFATLCAFLLTVIAFSVHQLRLNGLKKAHSMQQMFSRRLIDSQERERQAIAAELHDGLGQNLLVIKNRAFLADKVIENRELAGEQLKAISAIASDAVEEVRAITFNLHPYRLDRFGLSKSIAAMCTQVAESAAIRLRLDIDFIDGLFSREAERSIFRVIQESLNNIAKHSNATDASVSVKLQKDDVTITIRDEGQGFEPSQTIGSGFGLLGMAERIRLLGGAYSILSSPNCGTTISIRVKLEQ